MAFMFANGIANIHNKLIDVNGTGDTIMAVLINSTGVANLQRDTHADMADVNSAWYVLKTTSNALGRLTITMSAANIDGANNEVEFDSATSLTWTTVGDTGPTQNAKGIVVFSSIGTTSEDLLICMLDFLGGAISTNGSSITVDFHAEGLFKAAY